MNTLKTKRKNWFSEAKMNKAYRPWSRSGKYIKSQAAKCERRAGKVEIRFDLATN